MSKRKSLHEPWVHFHAGRLIALIVIIAFVGTLNQFSRDYSYVQDETLYSYGRSVMNILLTHEIEVTNAYGDKQNITLIHALGKNEAEDLWEDQIDPLIPPQIGYSIDYYNGNKWEPFGQEYSRPKANALKTVAVVSTVPVIVINEEIYYPYTYTTGCPASSDAAHSAGNTCGIPENLYQPDEFATGHNKTDSPYGTAFVRVVVQV